MLPSILNQYHENGKWKSLQIVTYRGLAKVGQCWKKDVWFLRKCMGCSDGYDANRRREEGNCAAAYPGYTQYWIFESNQVARNAFAHFNNVEFKKFTY